MQHETGGRSLVCCTDGLLSVDDTQFQTSFSEVYSADSLQVPWHAILGNHDYGECWTEESCAEVTARCQGQPDCYLSPLHQVCDSLEVAGDEGNSQSVYLIL